MSLRDDSSGRSRDTLRMMLRIRRLDEKLISLVSADPALLRGHYHVSVGQEASAAAACAALRNDDYVFTTHRNHGHVVAKGGDLGRVLAEILGRADGYARGREGTFHVAVPELGILHTSAIVGGCLPLAAGVAFANRLRETGKATLVFFGDGAMEEGAFCETLNMAQLWQIPLIFYMENNSVTPQERSGRGSPTSSHSARALTDVPLAFGIQTQTLDGADADLVYERVCSLVERVRKGEGPFFIEARTSRWPGNYAQLPALLGGEMDIAWSWDPTAAPEAVRRWEQDSDPVLLYARRLLDEGALSREDLVQMDAQVQDEVRQAADFALASPAPRPEGALEHVFA